MNFLWGAATSSHQVEGGNHLNDWWAWEAEGKIEGGVKSGEATDHWNRFPADLAMAAEAGMNTYRFSIEWSRIEPEEDRFDEAALDRYEAMVAECERLGLLPMITLHHFTLPLWIAEKGGFSWDGIPALFERYARKVISRLGARVPLWCTLNEPLVLTSGGYLGKFMPPAMYSPVLAARATANQLRCHVRAYDAIHDLVKERKGAFRDHPLLAGIAHNMLDFLPDRAWHPMELLLARTFNRFYNVAWLDAVTGGKQNFGVPFLLPNAPPVPEARGRKTSDYLGINYYTKAYAQWRPRDASSSSTVELPVGLAFSRRSEQASDLGWAIHPSGFRKVLNAAGRYGLPIYVTENGIADDQDLLRPTYLKLHLEALKQSIEEDGLDIRGYYHWSLLDNFEWSKGFKPRFGLYRVDYETQARTPTDSLKLYREWIRSKSASESP